MSSASYNRQVVIQPAATGFNDLTVNASEKTGTGIDTRGRTQMTVTLKAVRAAATAWTVKVETSPDRWQVASDALATWSEVPMETLSAGTATVDSPLVWTRTTSSSFTIDIVNMPLNCTAIRLKISNTAGTTDTAKVWVTLGTN